MQVPECTGRSSVAWAAMCMETALGFIVGRFDC